MPSWAIRNCGLMLFKALLKRLNGGTDTASTKASSSHRRLSHLMYEKYPNLPDLLMRLLRQELPEPLICRGEPRAAMQAQRVFPALEVIESSGIPRKYKVEILHALWFYSESCDWSIREKAAKTLSFVLDNANMIEEITRLLSTNFKSQNALHGKLLCLRFLLSRNQAPLFGNQISM